MATSMGLPAGANSRGQGQHGRVPATMVGALLGFLVGVVAVGVVWLVTFARAIAGVGTFQLDGFIEVVESQGSVATLLGPGLLLVPLLIAVIGALVGLLVARRARQR